MIDKLNRCLLYITLFLTPVIFLPITHEFFTTTKAYFLATITLTMAFLGMASLMVTKKALYHMTPFDKPLLLFVGAVLFSVLISAPNKIGALSSLPFGLGIVVIFALFFTSVSQQKERVIHGFFHTLSMAGVVLAVIEIIYLVQPFATLSLPSPLSFLADPLFTPVGTQLELVILLIVIGVYELSSLTGVQKNKLVHSMLSIVIFAGALIGGYRLFATNQTASPISQLPPATVSWYSAVETLKNPRTALFGVGPDNFVSIFTRAKPRTYNTTPLWLVNYHQSRSALLHIATETGLLGVVAFITLLLYGIRDALFIRRKKHELAGALASLLCMLIILLVLLPLTFISLFLLFFLLGAIAAISRSVSITAPTFELSTHKNSAFFYTFISIIVVFGAGSVYLVGRSYAAEIAYRQSLDALGGSNAQTLYQNSRRAAVLNPYNELFRRHFSQVNILIADRLAQKKDITDVDRQTIAQAVQGAIQEAKAVVTLNPQRAQNWENLALVYRMVLSVAQGADAWTVASYQQAIATDPVNPALRLALGGVYYTLTDFKTAINYYTQAVNLKPDWANAHYNLAWTYFQNKDYELAVQHMAFVTQLLATNSADKTKAQKDLAEFQKSAQADQEASAPAGLNTGDQSDQTPLSLPQQPSNSLQNPISLPENAAPVATSEAR